MNIDALITATEEKLSRLKTMKAQQEQEVSEALAQSDVYKNTYESMFDGLKLIADEEHPFNLVLPMIVKANMFYLYNEKRYVAIADGTATEENLDTMLTLWDLEEEEEPIPTGQPPVEEE